MNEKKISLNLGSIFIDKHTWEMAKKIRGYDRETIRQVIISNGVESLYSDIAVNNYCPHGNPASAGPCYSCDREEGEE